MNLAFLTLPVAALFLAMVYINNQTPKSKHAQMAEYINSLGTTWKATTYDFLDDLKLGLMDGHSLKHAEFGFTAKSFTAEQLSAVPDSFDSATQWPNCQSIQEIRNQAKCGSCWAFSSSSVMSDRLCIGSGQRIQTRISPQDILTCCFSCGNGCDGGFPNAAWYYFINSGVVSGDGYGNNQWCQPYTIPADGNEYPTPPCQRQCLGAGQYFYNKTKGTSGYTLVGEDRFKAEISAHGPIVAAFTVYEDFRTYKSGIYVHQSGQALGGHAIRIVGYGTENGMKYWKIANSWSPNWGENGFFRMQRGVNMCGIEGDGLAGLVLV